MSDSLVKSLIQSWWTHWMAQRWGFGDHACHLWAATGLVVPSEWKRCFGGTIPVPIECVIIYRELLSQGKAEADLAEEIVAMTPVDERKRICEFWLGSVSLDQEKKRGANTVGELLGKIMNRHGLPSPVPADDHRVDGWRFVYACLRQAGLRELPEVDMERIKQGPALFISSECPSCIENLPLAVRSDKDPNDIELRTSEWSSVADAIRYLLKSKPAARTEPPVEVRRRMYLEQFPDPTSRHIALLRFKDGEARRSRIAHGPNWRNGS